MRATLDHFEIPVADSDRLTTFLEMVFGWVADEPGPDRSARSRVSGTRYRRLATADAEPGATPSPVHVGLFEGSAEVLDRATPVVRLTGETLEACLERVSLAGGRVVLEPRTVGDSGRFARFEDPEGNPWGLWEGSAALETG